MLKLLGLVIDKDVDSSMLSNIKYNKITKTLTATFNSGAVYNYFKVDRVDVKLLLSASAKGQSVGKVFDILIKKDENIEYELVGAV